MICFRETGIDGVRIAAPPRHSDSRGWLVEAYRDEWLRKAGLEEVLPRMAYVSMTGPGAGRGPHEHGDQTDCMFFAGTSKFRVFLWDNRAESPTQGRSVVLDCEAGEAALVVIPPGVVHGYRNVGEHDGMVVNLPNRLYRGDGASGPVDETRYEADPGSRFRREMEKGK